MTYMRVINMKDINFIEKRLKEVQTVLTPDNIDKNLIQAKDIVNCARDNNSKIIFAGNGASCTIANHGSLDFMNQLNVECCCFNDAGMITAYSNDFGYENALKRYIQFIAKKEDLCIFISSSGESINVIEACKEAVDRCCDVITLTGFERENSLSRLGDVNFWANSRDYNVVECVHNTWLVTICDLIVKDEKEKVGIHGRLF